MRRRLLKFSLFTASVLALFGVGIVLTPRSAPAAQASVPSDANATTPCVASPAPAQWKHVVVLMFENHQYNQVIGSADAPYITSLAHACASTTSWYDADYKSPGVLDGTYVSKPNYATLTSGLSPSAHGLLDDTYSTRTQVDNIYRQIRHAGKTAKDYFDATGTNCSASFAGDYHDAMRYYTGDSGADLAYCQTNDVPLSNFWTDLNSGNLPSFSMILPTNCENMHSCSTVSNVVQNGDNWAKNFLPNFFNSAQYKSGDTAFFFVWDEDTNIPNIEVAPSVIAGSTSPGTSHFGATRTWDEMLGLPYIGVTNNSPHPTEDLLATYNAGGTSTADTTPPTVSVTSPTSGATISGTTSVTASASDNVGVSKVEFYVDGALKSTDTSSTYSYSLDTTTLSNASHTLQAKAYDAAGNVGTSSTVTVTVQNGCSAVSAPYGQVTSTINVASAGTYHVWSRIMAPDNTNNSYTFQTDGNCNITMGDFAINANTWVWVNYKNGSTTTPADVNLTAGSHTITMAGREQGVKLDRVLFLSDTCVPTGTGDNCTTTADTTAPTVNITAPTSGATVKSPVAVTATATDNTGGSGVAKVDFLVDGTTQATITGAGPYTWNWTTTATGSHTIGAKATDVAGNVSTISSVTVTVSDSTAPTVSITSPASGATIAGTAAAISATASDNVGVAKVDFYVDGTLKGTDTVSPYAYSLDTTTLVNGNHALVAKATDAAGNVGTSSTVTVNVQNDTTAPTAPTGLTASAASATQVNLAWAAATDNVGVSKYQIQRNGVVIAQQAASTGTTYADTGVVASTAYSYVVYAVDGAGNVSPASNTASVTTPSAPDTIAPTAPTGLTATAASATQVNLSWTASTDTGGSGLKGYKIYRGGVLIATTTLGASSGTSYGDATVSGGTSYTYQVSAYDGAGNESAKSTSASVTTPATLSGDINGDGKVNIFDLSSLLSAWNTTNTASDLNHDGTVNVFDLSILLSHWTG